MLFGRTKAENKRKNIPGRFFQYRPGYTFALVFSKFNKYVYNSLLFGRMSAKINLPVEGKAHSHVGVGSSFRHSPKYVGDRTVLSSNSQQQVHFIQQTLMFRA